MLGAQTHEDEAGRRRQAQQLRDKELVVKLHLRQLLHAKLYLLFRDDFNNPIAGYVGTDGEIRGRGWRRPVDTPTLYERLNQYFSNARFRPHPWFDPWVQALGELGVSYTHGTAAHVDLCPWPTRPMSNLPNHDRFTTLVTQGLSWFWRCIPLAANLRLVLMAGAVNQKYYLNEFLGTAGNHSDTALIGKVSRGGTPFVGYHQLRVASKELPVFFCNESPSSRMPAMLHVRVHEHRDRLTTFLS